MAGSPFRGLSRGSVALQEFRASSMARAARDALGRFTSYQHLMLDANTELGKAAASMAQRALRDAVADTGRPQRASQYLILALGEEGIGWKANSEGFQMGIYDGLNNDVRVRGYWRGLEEGSSVHVGRELRGFFIGRNGQRYGPSADRYRQDPRMPQTSRGALIIIQNPIPAYHYLEQGAQRFRDQRDQFADRIYARYLGQLPGYTGRGNQ
jgi:hypothetical protein